jgi:hypothetical protein
MRARLRIDATLGQAQALDGPPADKMLLHNLRCIFRPHVPVPHGIRINYHRGSVLALVKAAGFVDPHAAVEPCFPAQLFQPRMQFALAIACARGPRRIGGTDVVADKNVALKCRQECILPGRPILAWSSPE